MEEGFGRGDGGVEVLGEAAVSVDPGEEPLDRPVPFVDGEADPPLGVNRRRTRTLPKQIWFIAKFGEQAA